MLLKTKEIEAKEVAESFVKVFNPAHFDGKAVEFVRENYKKVKRKAKVQAIIQIESDVKIVINPYTEMSFWDWKKNFINIGILESFHYSFPREKLIEIVSSLLSHEISHENHTTVPEKIPYPFSLLNILEDERIEKLAKEKWGADFETLHLVSWMLFYQYEPAETFVNPYNLLITSRWKRWSDDVRELWDERLKHIKKLRLPSLKPYEKFLTDEYFDDVEKVLDDATNSKSTEELIENTLWFYEKWLKDTEDMEKDVSMGLGHGKGQNAGDIEEGQGQEKMPNDDGSNRSCNGGANGEPQEEGQENGSSQNEGVEGEGNGKESKSSRSDKLPEKAREWIEQELENDDDDTDGEKEKEWTIYDDDFTEDKESSYYFYTSELYEIDEKVVKMLQKVIERIKWEGITTENQRVMTGRRPDARRIENLINNPMRRKKETKKVHKPKVLFVIDGSGSMGGDPYRASVHIATAFMRSSLDVDVVITLSNGNFFPVKSEDQLERYKCNGATECLNSTRNIVKNPKYDLIIFFTDANVNRDDKRYLLEIKSDKVVGMLVTKQDKQAKDWLKRYFNKIVVANTINGLARQLAFSMRRGR